MECNSLSLSFEQLSQQIIRIDEQTRQSAIKAINQLATLRNWLIGAYIIEYEQNGSDRARYGEQVLKNLEKSINRKGLTVTLFQLSRLFYTYYPNIGEFIAKNYATVSHELQLDGNYVTLLHKFVNNITQPNQIQKGLTQPDEFHTPVEVLLSKMSFSHIRELLTIDDPLVRYFYETECIRGTWGVRELRRQIASNLHVRIGLSEDKIKTMQLLNQCAETDSFAVQIRQPYTFEFLGLEAKEVVSEDDLENALITHLEEFLLELGKGFCFEARQKRIIIDNEYYFADLVFYNRILHCNVIVELKNDEFRHEHIGQLNAYVSYYAENEMQPGDNPPVGILLCTRKGKKMVEYALGNLDNQLFVSTYQLQLPNRKQLEDFIKQKLKK